MARGDGTGGTGESEEGESQILNIRYQISSIKYQILNIKYLLGVRKDGRSSDGAASPVFRLGQGMKEMANKWEDNLRIWKQFV